MPIAGGVYVRSDGTRTGSTVNVTAKAAGVKCTAALADARENDFATAINACLFRDGSNAATDDLDIGSNKITALSDGVADTDAATVSQVNAAQAASQPIDAGLTDIAALAVTDGNFIVGDGTNWTVESGATARTSLGLGTGNSPQFTVIELGHATDTTISRVSAGRIAVEGSNVQMASDIGVALQAYSAKLDASILALTKQAATASSATLNIDMNSGWDVALTLSANVTTLTVSNWPATGTAGRLTLEIASTGSYNISDWPGTTIWSGGIAPTITSGNGKKDTVILTSNDGGSNFRGYIVSQNMS
jgi:hypothetical protein